MGVLDGKVAIVTGSSKHIGRSIALQMAEEGARVVTNSRSANSPTGTAEQVAGEIIAASGSAVAVYANVSTVEGGSRIVATALEHFGTVDILVNNAGYAYNDPIEEITEEQWDEIIGVNLKGLYTTTRAVVPVMKGKGYGRIVNIGSINGQGGQYGQVNYAAAKSGIHGFTKALAQEGASHNITVNAVAPGYVDTDMVRSVPEPVLRKIIDRIPMGRLGKAEDIARGVLFVVADEADFITGSTISINGGQHMY